MRRDDAGFTLIEMMTVAVIIGILAAIAIPNFNVYQCKAKQSEAKSNLGGLFISEKTFFGAYKTYTTDLVSIGWFPEGAPRYVYGFNDDAFPLGVPTGLTGYDVMRRSTDLASVRGAALALAGGSRYLITNMVDLQGTALTGAHLSSACSAAAATFTVGATGDVGTDAVLQRDIWTINQNRIPANWTNDCTDASEEPPPGGGGCNITGPTE